MKVGRLTLIFVFLVVFLAVVINIPKELQVKGETPRLLLINKTIKIDQKFPGIDLSGLLKRVNINRDFSFRKGLDLEGGTSVTLRANMREVAQDKKDQALDSARSVIERRVNLFGVSEATVQSAKTNNDYRILVDIPGVSDVNQAIALIGSTAKLTFWEPVASTSANLANPETLPFGITQLYNGPYAKQADLTGTDLKEAAVVFEDNTGKPSIQISFTSVGSKKFSEITKRNVGKQVSMVLDNFVISAPLVKERITQGVALITGDFTLDQAKALSVQLNAGALPVSLSVLEKKSIGATLGQSSLEKSLFAGVVGFFVIVIFMTALYGRLGVIASVALIVYTLIILALFRLIPVTLTLAGIAGFILSIGVAVDANILIFERMREELRRGRTREQAIEIGFTRAWSSIRDSNIASLITSGVLYYFGTGVVRGFAFTLAIGVLVSMFSAIIVTRTLLRLFYKTKKV